jgi:hypothetical protein
MSRQRTILPFTIALGALLCLAFAAGPGAQVVEYTNNFKFNIGQSVQPVFEGWSHAANGGFNFHFGYLNRNYVEMPHVPIGPNNQIEPAGPDRGQPTFFYTRTNRNLFTVHVPKDWPRNREVIWTLTVNGKTERAYGWLQSEWEIDPAGGAGAGGGSTSPERKANEPPRITAIAPVAAIQRGTSASLIATVADDGLPKPRPAGARRGAPVGQETPPTLRGGTTAPVNVPQLARGRGEVPAGATPAAAAPGGAGGPGNNDERPQGPTVSWMVWRGPAEVTFSRAQFDGDRRIVNATFTAPGEYVLRAVATDTLETGEPRTVTVVVQ